MRERTVWWVVWGLVALTILLSMAVVLALPERYVPWSPLAMLAWVAAAGALCAKLGADQGWDEYRPLWLRMTGMLGWFAAYFCAMRWGLMLFKPVGNQFTMLFPLTLPPAIRVLWTRARWLPGSHPRTYLITIAALACAHLLYFFSSISAFTGIYLIVIAVVSAVAARYPVRDHSARSTADTGTEEWRLCSGSADENA